VEYRIDNADWKPMSRVENLDPSVLELNMLDARSEQLRGYDLTPEAQVSMHLWRGSLPTGLAIGEHRIEVRAKLSDRWFNDVLNYRLLQAEP
jgi:hypothetical protein